MNYTDELNANDRRLAARLADFLPDEIYDSHVHPYRAEHFPAGTAPYLAGRGPFGCAEYTREIRRTVGERQVHGLFFGLPHKGADRAAINAWIEADVRAHGTPLSRALLLVSPADDPAAVAAALRSGRFSGLKVYHCYANLPQTGQARIEEFAPDWMWELLHEVRGVMLLHIMRDGAIADPENQQSLRRLCRAYPQARLVLAHIARSFNYRNARDGLHVVAELENAVVDTSAIAEADAFRVALRVLGPRRILWGSDFPISELRGRCITAGDDFFWLHPELLQGDAQAEAAQKMTLVGLESLLTLREACEDAGLTRGDIEDIFRRNALRLLAPTLPAEGLPL